ncbi:hypothetical protein, partial [Roseibium sp.]|uniref:hypothetical protein n=1 Tax=Roseibium sp. TaxID=1936156 RepID=UPI0025F5595C
NADIQLELAKGAFNAITAYQKVNDTICWKNWLEKLNSVVKRFPYSPQIREIASQTGINIPATLSERL